MRFPFPPCQHVHDHVTDFMEGAVPLHKWFIYWLHLRFCSLCRPVLLTYMALRKQGPRLLSPPKEPTQEALDALRKTTDRIRNLRKDLE